jgi:hypothetical protein
MKTRPYTPPPGYYDLPYTYAFNASSLTNGNNYQNQQVYIQGGYGDFAVRRVVGLNRLLATNGTGQFQIMRASQGVYQSSNPVQAPNSPELAIAPEEWYPETGQIGFDLYGISLPSQNLTAQLAFQGVRRLPGNVHNPNYKNQPRSFTYQTTATLTQTAPSAPVTTYTPINNYDFELHQLIIMKQSAASTTFATEAGTVVVTAKVAGPTGNLISVAFVTLGPSQPVTATVVGNAITVGLQTNSGGLSDGLTGDLVVALNAIPAVAALVLFTAPVNSAFQTFTPQFLTGGGAEVITSPICALSVYDHNFVTLSNIPIMDIFYNGGPGSPYENGAVVPPLFYRKDSQLQIDFYSEVTNPALLPVQIVVYMVGKKLYPCL